METEAEDGRSRCWILDCDRVSKSNILSYLILLPG